MACRYTKHRLSCRGEQSGGDLAEVSKVVNEDVDLVPQGPVVLEVLYGESLGCRGTGCFGSLERERSGGSHVGAEEFDLNHSEEIHDGGKSWLGYGIVARGKG